MANDGEVKIGITADDSDIKKKLNDVEDKAEKAADKLGDLGDSSKKSGKGFDIASVAIGNFISGGITELIGKIGEAISSLAGLADETREYREDMAKLNAAFSTAGHSTEAAQEAYDDFYKLLGESDRSVEAVNHLAELTSSTEELSKWSDIAAGVTAKFGDSLPIEGLTEAANETAKVGQVTGPLADALNWAGISEDAFNEKLKACSSEQERATLITNTLSTEYAEAAAEYNKLTASTQMAREATNRMEQAQARLGALIEPLTAGWTGMKASLLEFAANLGESVVNNIDKAKTAATGLNAEQRALAENAIKGADALKALNEASATNGQAINAQFDHVQELADELFELADASGTVNEKDRGRAEFILGELNSALGTQYTMTGNQIQQYDDMQKSIEAVINAERTRLLLAEYEDDYVEALKLEAEQKEAISEQEAAMYQKRNELEKARSDEAAKRAEIEAAIEAGASAQKLRLLGSELKAFTQATELRQKEYDAQREQLRELNEAHAESASLIEMYEGAKTAFLEGETEKGMQLLFDYEAALNGETESVVDGFDEQTRAAFDNVMETSKALEALKAEYEEAKKTPEGLTEAQKKEFEERIEALDEEAQAARQAFYDIGGDMVEGMIIGVTDKNGDTRWNLSAVMAQIVEDALEAAKEKGDIRSPSRVFRDEVGAMIAAGIEVGIEENADKPAKAVKTVFDTMAEVLAEEVKSAEDSVKEYQKEIAEITEDGKKEQVKLEKEKTEKLLELEERLAENKKKRNADRVKLEKEYAKNVEKINQQYSEKFLKLDEDTQNKIEKQLDNIKNTIDGKMEEIVELGERYKEDAAALWSDLEKSIAEVQGNYENQLASRTASIVSSLNIWNEATKNKTPGIVLQRNLQSQVKALEDYNNAIAVLEERNVSTAFINSLKELGVGSVGEIEELSKMTDSRLNAYVKLWEEKNRLAEQAAIEELEPLKKETERKIDELSDAALDKYAELRADFRAEGAELMADLKQAMIEAGEGGYDEIVGQIDEYNSAGEDLMSGVVAGIAEKSPEVAEAVSRAVKRAIAAAKAAAGIASPSKVMKKEVGANLAEGVNVGWAGKIDDVKKKMAADMQGIAARIKTAVSLEQARTVQGIGVRDTGFAEVAQAVGLQTAGINSLASEYRRGSSAQVTVPLVLDGRELGRAVVDLGNAETARTGASLSFV